MTESHPVNRAVLASDTQRIIEDGKQARELDGRTTPIPPVEINLYFNQLRQDLAKLNGQVDESFIDGAMQVIDNFRTAFNIPERTVFEEEA